MRKATTFAALILLLTTAAAAADLAQVTVTPDGPVWQGEDVAIDADCTPETATLSISQITIDTEQTQYSYNLDEDTLAFTNGSLDPDELRPFLFYPGDYAFAVTCSDADETETVFRNVTVRRLTFNLPRDRLEALYSGNASWLEVNVSTLERDSRNPSAIDAYVNGVKRSLYIDMNVTRREYSPVGTVTVSGQVSSPFEPVVSTVTLDVSRSSLSLADSTDADGRFSFSFPAPNDAGGYTATLRASKQEYLTARSSFGFHVTREPVLEVVIPSDVAVDPATNTTVTGFLRNVGNEPASIDTINASHPYVTAVELGNRTVHPNQVVNASVAVNVPASPDRPNVTAPIVFRYGDANTTHRLVLETGAATTGPSGFITAAPGAGTGILKYILAALALAAGLGVLVRKADVRQVSRDLPRPAEMGPGASDEQAVTEAVDRIKTELGD